MRLTGTIWPFFQDLVRTLLREAIGMGAAEPFAARFSSVTVAAREKLTRGPARLPCMHS